MFPVKLKPGGIRPTPSASSLKALQRAKERVLSKQTPAELKKRAIKAPPKPNKRSASVVQFIRNPAIATYVKLAAGGKCDLCQMPAPFEKNGEPFLHCHHVVWLARGGPDIIQNTVAICPNCHERMHQLDRKSDVKLLAARIQQRDPDLPTFDIIGFKPTMMPSQVGTTATLATIYPSATF
jgi:5-methylcytosine-specific restriction enzyme A